MTVTTVAGADGPSGPDSPEHQHRDPVLDAQAGAALTVLLRDHPAVAGELEEAIRAHTHLLELRQRATRAAAAATEASRRVASLAAKLDPANHRVLGFTGGAVLVAVVILLDAVPLNWAAEAFGLDATGSLLVTGILLLASVAAMAAIEMTRNDQRRRIVLAVLLLACLTLVILRTEFLTTVAAESWPAAVLQSVLLSAISGWAGPLWIGDRRADPAPQPDPCPLCRPAGPRCGHRRPGRRTTGVRHDGAAHGCAASDTDSLDAGLTSARRSRRCELGRALDGAVRALFPGL